MELKYFAKDNTDNKKMFDFIQMKLDETLKMHEDEEAIKKKLMEGKSFVKFFSNDCPACKGMAGEWSELEKKYSSNPNIKILSVNCIDTRMVCKKFKILNYPTMLFFDGGKVNETYSKGWNLKEFSAFIDEKLVVPEPPKNSTTNHVLYLTPETFNQSVSIKGIVFVKFNLLGCSHCVVSWFVD
jgi:thiol-disulfide isomerase/thioredoxin